ncbi:MAG: hypothetical protein AAFX75_14585 [Pseudomonadota bacterium]
MSKTKMNVNRVVTREHTPLSEEELLTVPLSQMHPSDYARHGELINRRLRKSEIATAKLETRIEMLREQTIANEELRENLRVGAWVKHRPGGVSYDYTTETFTGVPEGWPADAGDPDEAVCKYVETLFNNGEATEDETSSVDSAALQQYRKMMGD